MGMELNEQYEYKYDPLSSSGYPMIIYTHPVADIKALVARQLLTDTNRH